MTSPFRGTRAHRGWLLVAALASPACAGGAVGGGVQLETAADVAPASDGAARTDELEARIAELERRLASSEAARLAAEQALRLESARGSSVDSASASLGTFELPGDRPIGNTDEPDFEPSSVEGERVTLRLHEAPAYMAQVPVVTERLPVAPMPVPVSAASNPPGFSPQPPVQALPPASVATSVPGPASVPLAPPAPVSTRGAVGSTPAASDDLTDYRAGLAHLTARRFEPAIGALSAFLRDHPGSSQADDAMYWRATAYYALRRYREAVVDYERVVRIAPRGERSADALYHSGLCYRRLGEVARARTIFTRVQREYPESVAARLAAREDTT